MEFATQVDFPASAGEVAEMLATEEYVLETITATGATPGEVEITPRGNGAVTIASTVDMPTTEVPASYRSLVGPSLQVQRVDAWDGPRHDGARDGTLTIEVSGAPVRVNGHLQLVPTGPAACEMRLTGDIVASIPLFGRSIEKALADSVDKAVHVERQVALSWLARH